jgi:hypothetical protein
MSGSSTDKGGGKRRGSAVEFFNEELLRDFRRLLETQTTLAA